MLAASTIAACPLRLGDSLIMPTKSGRKNEYSYHSATKSVCALTDTSYADFPVLHAGEESNLEFDFDNIKACKAFSPHLTGEGKESAIQIEKFNVTVM